MPGCPSGMGEKRSEFVFRQWLIQVSEFYRNVIKPARREAAVEMPQARHDHPDDRRFDIRPRLIENEEIQAGAPGDIDAGKHLVARVVERPPSSLRRMR